MTTRRNFLKGSTTAVTTGIVFCSCGLLQSAHAQQPTRQKLSVTGSGKRVKTIDVHAHCHVPEANALMGLKVQPQSLVMSTERVAAMDQQGIDIEALRFKSWLMKI